MNVYFIVLSIVWQISLICISNLYISLPPVFLCTLLTTEVLFHFILMKLMFLDRSWQAIVPLIPRIWWRTPNRKKNSLIYFFRCFSLLDMFWNWNKSGLYHLLGNDFCIYCWMHAWWRHIWKARTVWSVVSRKFKTSWRWMRMFRCVGNIQVMFESVSVHTGTTMLGLGWPKWPIMKPFGGLKGV